MRVCGFWAAMVFFEEPPHSGICLLTHGTKFIYIAFVPDAQFLTVLLGMSVSYGGFVFASPGRILQVGTVLLLS